MIPPLAQKLAAFMSPLTALFQAPDPPSQPRAPVLPAPADSVSPSERIMRDNDRCTKVVQEMMSWNPPPGYFPGAPYSKDAEMPDHLRAAYEDGGCFEFVVNEFFVVFVIDTSPNILLRDMYPSRWAAAADTISKYLIRVSQKNVAAKATIMPTSTSGHLICPLTHVNEHHVFSAAMQRIPPVGAGLWLNYLNYHWRVRHVNTRVIIFSDGHIGENRQCFLEALQRFPIPHHFDCIGLAGSPAQVDEEVLRTLASSGRDGTPRYRWIGQADELICTFADLDLEDEQ